MWDLRTFAQFQGSKASSGLFQGFMGGHMYYGSLQWRLGIVRWLQSLVADLGDSGSIAMGGRFSVPALSYLCSFAVGALAFWSWLGAVAFRHPLFVGGCAAIGRACWSCLPAWQMSS